MAVENTGSARPYIILKPNRLSHQAEESFKTLRTNIEFSGVGVQCICLTSAMPGDGKSTVSYNLARVFAESGHSTLFIDADLRKSKIRNRYGREGNAGSGLSYYLIGRKSYEETVAVTNVDNLSVIVSGHFPPNPSELLGSNRFKQLIERARQEFSVIIIDTPPIGSVIDAAIVTHSCDGVVLVLKEGQISYRFAQNCKEQLEAAQKPVLGCVLNGVDMSKHGYYGKYYGHYYGSYYGKE